MKNMAAMLGAMVFLRRVDQEEPQVLQYARIAYVMYIMITAGIYFLLHRRILNRRDTKTVTISPSAKQPSFFEALAAAKGQMAEGIAEAEKDASSEDDAEEDGSEEEDNKNDKGKEPDGDSMQEDTSKEEDAPKEEVITIMEYDIRQMAAARKSWLMNTCLLAAINYKMESVSPLIMSCLMGIMRLYDDPLVQIHLRGEPSVGKLSRPFTPEKNPLANLLKEFAPKSPDAGAGDSASSPSARVAQPEEDLHDDGDSDEDEGPPPTIDDLKDDHIKSDFDDKDQEQDAESKKTN